MGVSVVVRPGRPGQRSVHPPVCLEQLYYQAWDCQDPGTLRSVCETPSAAPVPKIHSGPTPWSRPRQAAPSRDADARCGFAPRPTPASRIPRVPRCATNLALHPRPRDSQTLFGLRQLCWRTGAEVPESTLDHSVRLRPRRAPARTRYPHRSSRPISQAHDTSQSHRLRRSCRRPGAELLESPGAQQTSHLTLVRVTPRPCLEPTSSAGGREQSSRSPHWTAPSDSVRAARLRGPASRRARARPAARSGPEPPSPRRK